MKTNSTKRIEFKERFKGKTSIMGKNGHIGVAIDTKNPIED
jgi:hypothetical protein